MITPVPLVDPATATGRIAELLATVQRRLGVTPNMAKAMANGPALLHDRARATVKVQAAEDAWNSPGAARVAAAYTTDTVWRNRSQFLHGRDEVISFLTTTWQLEQDYASRKSHWAFTADRIAVRFQYERHDATGQWWRSYGNENWQLDRAGDVRRREASIENVAITAEQRRILGPRPDDHTDHDLPIE